MYSTVLYWAAQGSLVYQITQSHSREDGHHRNEFHTGCVAVFSIASTHLRVVFLQHCCVAFPPLMIRDPTTAPNHPLVTTDVLIDFSAEVLPLCGVFVTLLNEISARLGVLVVFVEEGVCAESVFVAIALVAFHPFRVP